MAESLYKDVSTRYAYKIRFHCDGIDPFHLDMDKCLDSLPDNVGFFDIVNYCVDKDSPYTNDSFKSYKALDAYKFYANGWIKKIGSRKQENGFIVITKVGHSQKMSEKPLHCWVSIDANGIILCGHCTCMAGLGEVCTHIGATLFLLADWCQRSKDLNLPNESCTDVLAKWVVPTNKNADMAKAKDIIWNKKQVFACAELIEPLPAFTDVQINDLLSRISVGGTCALMAMRAPFSEKFIPLNSAEKVAGLEPDDVDIDCNVKELFFTSLFSEEFEAMSLEDLQSYADAIEWTYKDQEMSLIENVTKLQRKSKLWFRFRAGRITGSNFRAVCRTRLSPSISLITKICYPEQNQFSSKYTQYGIDNEEYAMRVYVELIKESHTNFVVEKSGLVINNLYPHFGVSPDGISNCDCCGRGTVEIKCPWTLRNDDWEGYFAKSNCPLGTHDDGTFFLLEQHEYNFQVQLQMQLLDVNFCDFVIWNKESTTIVRVLRNDKFWEKEYPIAENYWRKIVLPELLGHYFSNARKAELKKQQQFLAIQAENNQQLMEKRQQFAAANVKPELLSLLRNPEE